MQIEDVNFFKWHPAIAGDKLAAGSTELSVFSPIISPMYADESIESETSAIEIKTIPSNGGDECAGFLEIDLQLNDNHRLYQFLSSNTLH